MWISPTVGVILQMWKLRTTGRIVNDQGPTQANQLVLGGGGTVWKAILKKSRGENG